MLGPTLTIDRSGGGPAGRPAPRGDAPHAPLGLPPRPRDPDHRPLPPPGPRHQRGRELCDLHPLAPPGAGPVAPGSLPGGIPAARTLASTFICGVEPSLF